jgi:hypothetical protein
MHQLSKKIVALTLLLLAVSPQLIRAQTNTNTNTTTNPPRAILIDETTMQPVQVNTNNQAGAALNGTNGTSQGAGAAGSIGNAATCVSSSALTNMAKQAVSGLVSSYTSSYTSAAVPTEPVKLVEKEVGGLTSLGVSWDQIGFCLINTIIDYIGKATVAWINGGFQGNPVFVENPEQFFADIADIQAGQFINELSGGFLCGPSKNLVRVNLANSYNNKISPYGQRAQCSFTGISGNIEKFTSGQSFSWADWISYTQNSNNNPLGATYNARVELDRRVAQSVGTQSTLLNWGRGFLSFTDPETKKITSPGSVIEGQVNQRLFSGENRIQIADEFDEIVNALVNSLVKIAINEATQKN